MDSAIKDTTKAIHPSGNKKWEQASKNGHATCHQLQQPKTVTSSHIIASGYTHCVQIHWFNAPQLFILMKRHLHQFSLQTASNIIQPSFTGTSHFSPQTALTIGQPLETGAPHKINHNRSISITWPWHFINVLIQYKLTNSYIFGQSFALHAH